MKNYIIIPGSGSTPFDNWYHWAQQELENKGFNVVVPYLGQGEFQNYKTWSKIIGAYVKAGIIGKQTTIIAHDVACVFITRFLVENKVSVDGVITVSPFNTILGMEDDKLNKSFITKNDKLKKVERFVKFYHAFISDNDPIVSEDVFEKFCETVGAKKHVVGGAGHFSGENCKGGFKDLIDLIDNINKII